MRRTLPSAEPSDPYNYSFPALRGIQAGREFYVAMCPMKLVPKIFTFDGGEVPPELRAQRVLNKARIPEIAKYITTNPRDYVFSSITASVDKRVQFTPVGDGKAPSQLGQLVIPMSARIVINDGQHRRAAIEEALEQRPDLGDETLSVVFFQDAGLKRSQQMFADLNKHAVRPTRSLGILYDNRDPFATLAKTLVERVPTFRGFTEVGKTTISNRSRKLFTLSTIFQATKALLGGESRKTPPTRRDEELAAAYWGELLDHIPEWRLAVEGKVSCAELRQDFVHAHGIALHALGRAGYSLVGRYPDDWKSRLSKLDEIDWHRTNARLWEGRALMGGRASKVPMNIILTGNLLKTILGLPLTPAEHQAETSFRKGSARGAEA
ncbi:MAG: DNA sulfur modification protein DndB [Nitrososphaerota archaeon]|nr:DNA sulfur modification protein DndB [Nitrososphaerota archaeon]MDG6949747.1 DNA sulfur modification protein DndB [Nitrososphaerota archaeon]